MGGLCSTANQDFQSAAIRNKQLESINKKDFVTDSKRIKLLLLGAGESGKSTIFKQMKIIYGTPFPVEERKQLVSIVHANVITNTRLLAQACSKLAALTNPGLKSELDLVPDAEDTLLDDKVANVLRRIWQDEGAQKTWVLRAQFQVQDSLAWYMQHLDRLSAIDYVPTVDDILRARVRTSGIVEETYLIDQVEFCMFDVGGQRNERKKWINIFDNCAAMLFVIATQEYDEMLYEDDTVNRMDEAVQLWEETINLKTFRHTSIILFLNKDDLFREKLKTIPFRVEGKRNVDFTGINFSESGGDFNRAYNQAIEYLIAKFVSKNKSPEREIYHHVTCATDTNNVRVVFGAVKDTILKNNLRGSGFMD
ncbi:hypothetical protein BASA81_006428 [Batrachochytrium salamandrivorans]|nr:hypothetical protein BASA81_006428 [Batrachochytrium salamandrivorans]